MRLGPDWALPLIAGLFWPDRRRTLVLDRTQWAIGTREVNRVVLAVATRNFRAPVLWTLLPRSGNRGTAARIAMIERYLTHFPVSSVAILLAERESIGARWLNFLGDLEIPFAIRLREDRFAGGEALVRPRGDRGRLRTHPRRWPVRHPPDAKLPRPSLGKGRRRVYLHLRR